MIKSFLKISLVQAELSWENIPANLKHFDELLDSIKDTDLIILPEMFSTGFTMNTSVAEGMEGGAIKWMQNKAKEKKVAIMGSLVFREGDHVYNRLIWMNEDGTSQHYDKRHLFRMAKEHEYYAPGSKKLIVTLKGWKICPLVCYDLRFPVWSRNHFSANGEAEYDVLIYVANWPEKRRLPWNKLLPARGIENLSYVVGVNRVGRDGNGIPYSGDSATYDYMGMRLTNMEPFKETIETVSLDRDQLAHYRKAFPAFQDADDFIINGI